MAKRIGCVALTCLSALLLSACGSATEPGRSSSNSATASAAAGSDLKGIPQTAIIDETNSSVTLPGDSVNVSKSDENVFMTAWTLAAAACYRDNGITWWGTDYRTAGPYDHVYNDMGPWTKKIAAEFGFVRPRTRTTLARLGMIGEPGSAQNDANTTAGDKDAPEHPNRAILNNPQLADKLKLTATSCRVTPDVIKWDPQKVWDKTRPWGGELGSAGTTVMHQPEYAKLRDELHACYTESGLTPLPTTADNTDGVEVKGQEDYVNEAQINLALKVVACKEKTHFIQRYADLVAKEQWTIINKYAKEITAFDAWKKEHLKEAQQYISQHTDILFHYK